VPDQAKIDAEPTICEHLRKPNAPLCSRCDGDVPATDRKAVAVVCSRCTAYLVHIWPDRRNRATAGNPCKGCGKPLPTSRQRGLCADCRTAANRQSARERVRRHRTEALLRKTASAALV